MKAFSLVFAFLALVGCSQVQSSGPVIKFFYGDSLMKTADGSKVIHQGQTLVKLTVFKSEGKIVEVVTQSPSRGQKKPMQYMSMLTREGNSLVYKTNDSAKSYSGNLTYDNESLESWVYNITMKDGNKLGGTGRYVEDSLKSEKLYTKADGTVMFKIVEDLKSIDEATYNQRLKDLMK